MTTRRTSLLLVALMAVVMAAGAGCATSGSSGAGYSAVSGFEDCANLYPPVTYSYPTSYYPPNDEDGPCSAYPRVEGYYPEYVVQRPVREVTSAQARDHHGHVVSRGEPREWSSRFGDGSSGTSSSGSSGSSGSDGGATVPRMEPIPVGSPSPGQSPGPGTVTVQPREH